MTWSLVRTLGAGASRGGRDRLESIGAVGASDNKIGLLTLSKIVLMGHTYGIESFKYIKAG